MPRHTILVLLLGLLAPACGMDVAGEPAVCDEAVSVLRECGAGIEESPFRSCTGAEQNDATTILDLYGAGGCELLQDRKADGEVCSAVSSLCVAHGVETLAPFTTDGCSMFPDGTPSQPTLWQQCCIVHDFAYYTGGMRKERADADQALYECVAAVAGEALGNLMWTGVRVGGTPAFDTPWRWGYGWAYDPFDGYRDLPFEQRAAAQAEIDRYLANPWPVPGFEDRRSALEDDVESVPELEATVAELEAATAQL